MAEATDTIGRLRQNLIDAGCSEDLTKNCIELAKENKWKNILPLLSKQRVGLLDIVHHGQKQIDCLDFLVYDITKKYLGGFENGNKTQLSSRMG